MVNNKFVINVESNFDLYSIPSGQLPSVNHRIQSYSHLWERRTKYPVLIAKRRRSRRWFIHLIEDHVRCSLTGSLSKPFLNFWKSHLTSHKFSIGCHCCCCLIRRFGSCCTFSLCQNHSSSYLSRTILLPIFIIQNRGSPPSVVNFTRVARKKASIVGGARNEVESGSFEMANTLNSY